MRLLYRGMPERHTPAACPGAAGPPIADESRCSLSPPYRRSRALWPVSPASRRVATIRLVMPPSPPAVSSLLGRDPAGDGPRRRDAGTGDVRGRDPAGDGRRCPRNEPSRRRDVGTGQRGRRQPLGRDPAGVWPTDRYPVQRPSVATWARGDGRLAAIRQVMAQRPRTGTPRRRDVGPERRTWPRSGRCAPSPPTRPAGLADAPAHVAQFRTCGDRGRSPRRWCRLAGRRDSGHVGDVAAWPRSGRGWPTTTAPSSRTPTRPAPL
jgi:hypothetical protein